MTDSYTAMAATLKDPLEGAGGSQALGINNAGQVVGFYIDAGNRGHGYLYTGGNYFTLDDPLGNSTLPEHN